ncbi:MAG: ComF family protein [Candidatus Hydrogenedentales bacterium]
MNRAVALAAKNLFFPQFCNSCGLRLLTEENGYFCPTCWELPLRIHRPFCTVCGRPHAGETGFGTQANFPCARCRDRGPQPFRRIYGAAVYEGAIADAVKLLKFHDKPRLARPLAEEMGEMAARELDCAAYNWIVPVPLHRVRGRERGFNQAELLANALLPLFPNAQLSTALGRIRPTRTQSSIKDVHERTQNVRGAFAVDAEVSYAAGIIVLIDDVVTSGGTVGECARALTIAGAVAVDVLAAALPVELASL